MVGQRRGLFQELLPDQERVLGRDHPDTLDTLGSLGAWAFVNGDPAGAWKYLREGLARAESPRFGGRTLDDAQIAWLDSNFRVWRTEDRRYSQPRASLIARPTAILPR